MMVMIHLIFYSLFLFLGGSRSFSANIIQSRNDSNDANGVYIVYMGATDSTNGFLRNDHADILNSLLIRNEKALVRNYRYGFSGFAARLSKDEAALIAQKPGVLSVFPDPVLKLHTTRSWDFLNLESHIKIHSDTSTLTNSSFSSDIVIGIVDTGIWPESPSFSDKGMEPVPSHWNGTCMNSNNFNSSNCNRKLIGARYYPGAGFTSARDDVGHGTHVASIAAGTHVANASYNGLAEGTARGGFPESRLAIYRACYNFGCIGSAILAAIDDAIADGVHVLSLSIGSTPGSLPHLLTDVVAIGAFHAVERGIMVVCSAGNAGPGSKTVVNDAPWIMTVAATTMDRDFQSNVVLGNNKVIKGEAINFSPLSSSPDYPLIYGETAMRSGSTVDEARQCLPGALDGNKLKGKILLCNVRQNGTTIEVKDMVEESGPLGLIVVSDQSRAVAADFGNFSGTIITSKDAPTILEYFNSTSNPLATILPTVVVINYKPAPMVVYFSARGPSTLSKNILKPDIAAPGVDILAAWIGNGYKFDSGTSMSCPHVSGLAGRVKSANPTWSPSAIRSAIMTTASPTNNMKAPITMDSGLIATSYDYGAGEITTSAPLQPGLVYETSTIDYLMYLCYIGFDTATVKVISRTVPASFTCPKDSSSDLISNINYPSISISNFNGRGGGAVNVTRTVKNVDEEDEIVYSPIVDAPSGVNVKLIPHQLHFTKRRKTLNYQVIFSLTSTSYLKEDLFGSITWSSNKYNVRIPFVLTN